MGFFVSRRFAEPRAAHAVLRTAAKPKRARDTAPGSGYGKFSGAQQPKSGSTDLSPEIATYPRYARGHAEAYAPVSGSERDLLDPAVGEAEDAVLRHRQAQRLLSRQAGVKAAQDAGHDTMADGEYLFSTSARA